MSTDQDVCQKCPNGTTSLLNATECREWMVWYLKWSDAYSIVVVIGTGVGLLLLIFSFSFFILHKNNPIIKPTLAYTCIMEFGLITSFGGVLVFLGKQSADQCMAQQAMYGLGFTLCVSCILTKAFRTFIAYMASDPHTQHRLRRIDRPFGIIVLLTAVQGFICLFWFVFDRPVVEEKESKTPLTITHLCTQGSSMAGFGAMHTYIAVLAVVCFLLAFKGKDNDTEPIVFSMIIHLLAWLCFIPVFLTQKELSPIIQISAIMVSNYGVIFCHFTPKWFKIISENMEHSNALWVSTNQPTDSLCDSAIGSYSTDGSVDSLPFPNLESSAPAGPAQGLNVANSVTTPSTVPSEQLGIADDEMSDLESVRDRVSSEEPDPISDTVSSVSSARGVGMSCWDNRLDRDCLEDTAIREHSTTVDSETASWYQNSVSIRYRRTRSF